MARKQKKTNATPQPASPSESVSGYFRRVFADNPQLLEGRSNDAILERWRSDHPGEPLSDPVKNGLQNVKGILRSRGQKGKRRAARTQAAAEVGPPAAPIK